MTNVRALFFACAFLVGCEAARADSAPFCADQVGCPDGTRCIDGTRCEGKVRSGVGASPKADLPGVQVGDGGGIGIDGSILPPTGDGGIVQPDAGPGLCGGGLLSCGNQCVVGTSDTQNCGGCGVACRPTEDCRLGVCCSPALTVCQNACVDTLSDSRNCGTCGFDCEGLRCVLGSCAPDVP